MAQYLERIYSTQHAVHRAKVANLEYKSLYSDKYEGKPGPKRRCHTPPPPSLLTINSTIIIYDATRLAPPPKSTMVTNIYRHL